MLSVHLSIEPESQALDELCERLHNCVGWVPQLEPTFSLVAAVLRFVTNTTTHARFGMYTGWDLSNRIPDHLSTTHKLRLSGVILQAIWRWGHARDSTTFYWLESTYKKLLADGDETLVILKTNCFLIMAITLGLQIDIRDLYAPKNKYV